MLNDGNDMASIIIIAIVALLVILLIVRNIRVVPQARAFVIERLGAYNGTWQVGLHFKIPIIDRIANRVSLKENVLDFPPQPVITKDNVTIEIDTVIYFQVTDPKLYTYGVEYPMAAIENLTATTLRNIIGDLELDESLTSREHINARMREVLDEATDAWGVKINRVEVKNITPPADIQTAMEKQMRAERERRESILRAEGEKKSAVLIAEGNKQARILEAEAKKQAKILEAEATKEMQILEATGESEAILLVQKATADGIKMIVESNPTDPVLTLKGLEAFAKAADGRATKIIIPSNIQGLAGLATSLAEIVAPAEAANKAPKVADATVDVKA
jgi:regulator of protease activity HflC (stomatin/prohibitin superfamily)